MSDIVQRLRDRAYAFKAPDPLLEEAADEIERLRIGSAQSRETVPVTNHDAVPAASRWVTVSKKLPRWCEAVIVAYRRYDWSNKAHKYRKRKKLGVTAATYWGDNWDNGPRFAIGQNHIVEEPVAWMPLPEPPEVTK